MAEEHIPCANGKYTVVLRDDGTSTALRYGEPWPAYEGQTTISNLAFALACDLRDAREEIKRLGGAA